MVNLHTVRKGIQELLIKMPEEAHSNLKSFTLKTVVQKVFVVFNNIIQCVIRLIMELMFRGFQNYDKCQFCLSILILTLPYLKTYL